MNHRHILIGGLALLAATSWLQAQATSTGTSGAPASARQAEAIRDHADEADDLVDSLLEWRHIVTWRGDGNTLPPEGPANTLISIDKAHAQRLIKLLDALETQLPQDRSGETGKEALRGDLRAHVRKAKSIARDELQAPHARETAGGTLVTVDRTALRRLEVELDAIAALVPRELG
jgi:hypothetical protein